MSKGIWWALAAAVLFGISTPLAKLLLANTSPQLLAGLLYLGSGLGLLTLRLAKRTLISIAEAPIPKSGIPSLVLAIAFGGVVAPVLLLLGLSRIPASSAALLLNLEGVFTGVLAWMLFRENIGRRIAIGMCFITAGGLLLSWSGRFEAGVTGALAIAGACFCWGMDNNLTQKISAADPMIIATIKGLAAGSVNVVLALFTGRWSAWSWPLTGALFLGFVSYGLSLVFYILALRNLGTARTGNYFSIAPFVGAVASVVLWSEPLTFQFVTAGALMAAGIWLHVSERHEHVHVHEPLTHEHSHTHDEHHQHEHAPDDPPGEPHSHPHRHEPLEHSHPHYPDVHHRHSH
jgi:drug/metabolite transporter (DMT)-like permease